MGAGSFDRRCDEQAVRRVSVLERVQPIRTQRSAIAQRQDFNARPIGEVFYPEMFYPGVERANQFNSPVGNQLGDLPDGEGADQDGAAVPPAGFDQVERVRAQPLMAAFQPQAICVSNSISPVNAQARYIEPGGGQGQLRRRPEQIPVEGQKGFPSAQSGQAARASPGTPAKAASTPRQPPDDGDGCGWRPGAAGRGTSLSPTVAAAWVRPSMPAWCSNPASRICGASVRDKSR